MRWLKFFSRPVMDDPVFGNLVYKRGAWRGAVSIPAISTGNVPLEIWAGKDSAIRVFYPTLECIRNNPEDVRKQIAEAAFATYQMYVKEDEREGNLTGENVASEADIWRILSPFKLTLTQQKKHYDSIIWLQVHWTNPHFFAAYFKGPKLYLLDVDG